MQIMKKLSSKLKPVYSYFRQMGRTYKLHTVKTERLYVSLENTK